MKTFLDLLFWMKKEAPSSLNEFWSQGRGLSPWLPFFISTMDFFIIFSQRKPSPFNNLMVSSQSILNYMIDLFITAGTMWKNKSCSMQHIQIPLPPPKKTTPYPDRNQNKVPNFYFPIKHEIPQFTVTFTLGFQPMNDLKISTNYIRIYLMSWLRPLSGFCILCT